MNRISSNKRNCLIHVSMHVEILQKKQLNYNRDFQLPRWPKENASDWDAIGPELDSRI